MFVNSRVNDLDYFDTVYHVYMNTVHINEHTEHNLNKYTSITPTCFRDYCVIHKKRVLATSGHLYTEKSVIKFLEQDAALQGIHIEQGAVLHLEKKAAITPEAAGQFLMRRPHSQDIIFCGEDD
jgi:hypothetical protein